MHVHLLEITLARSTGHCNEGLLGQVLTRKDVHVWTAIQNRDPFWTEKVLGRTSRPLGR